MPIYEYQCPFCNYHLESLQKMSDAPLTECPHCKKKGLRRLVSAAGFQLKGTGWYATDYRDKGKSKEKEKEKETETKEGDKSKTSADVSSDTSKSSKKDKPGEGSKSSTSGETSSGDK